MGDLFRLQDDIARRVVRSAGAAAVGRGRVARRPTARTTPAPTSSTSARTSWPAPTTGFRRARDLYQRCLELDPRFAPAWAHLGRCHRVIGKYIEAAPDSERRAEEAFRRALALNPQLSVAHKFYANLEADIGQAQRRARPPAGRGRPSRQRSGALRGARARLPLLRPVRTFDRRARGGAPARSERPHELDQTLLDDRRHRPAPGRRSRRASIAGADDGIRVIGLGLAGRRDEARERLLAMRQSSRIPIFESWIEYLTAWLDRRPADMAHAACPPQQAEDPGGSGSDLPGGVAALRRRRARRRARLPRRAVAKGYFVAPTLASGRSSMRCGTFRLSARCWRKQKPAASGRWLRSARPAASG